MIRELTIKELECSILFPGREKLFAGGLDTVADHSFSLPKERRPFRDRSEADKLRVPNQSFGVEGYVEVVDVDRVEVDDGVMQRSNVAVEDGLDADLAVGRDEIRHDAMNDSVFRQDDAVIDVDRLGEEAIDSRPTAKGCGAGDADMERDTCGNRDVFRTLIELLRVGDSRENKSR